MSKSVALYARVSTSDGRQDPEVQLSQLRTYCEQRGLRIHDEFVDHMSGSRDDRPALKKMMAAARKREFDLILVWKFDRFARSTRALVLALEEFQQIGMDFISYSENIDTSSPMGKAMFVMVSAMAEFERSLIQERVCAGLQKARENGVRLGRQRVAFDAAKALTLKAKGLGVRRIAKQLGVSHGTIHSYLKAVQKTHAPQEA